MSRVIKILLTYLLNVDNGPQCQMQPSSQADAGLTFGLHEHRLTNRCTLSRLLSRYRGTGGKRTVSPALYHFRPRRSAIVSEQFYPTFWKEKDIFDTGV